LAVAASCVKCQCSNKTETNKEEDSSRRRAVPWGAPRRSTRQEYISSGRVQPAWLELPLQQMIISGYSLTDDDYRARTRPDLGCSTPSRRDRATIPCSFSTFAHVINRAYATSCNSISLSSHDLKPSRLRLTMRSLHQISNQTLVQHCLQPKV